MCGIVTTNAGCRHQRKERRLQRAGVSKMKGSGARSALKIWISEEWGDVRRVLGVRTSSSEKDQAEKIGKLLKNKSIPWQRRRRLLQVVTGTFSCGQQPVNYGHKEKAECTLCKKAHEENGSSWKGEEVLNELWQNIWTAAKGNNWTYLKCRMPRTKGSIHSCAQCVHQGVATGN